ncbi:MAG: iron ABC transporter permease [Thermoplasmata archaeon]|jgi:iron complex transport system permease protein|nr:iron ABC transporter permease [Thermoplasmata archaeon]
MTGDTIETYEDLVRLRRKNITKAIIAISATVVAFLVSFVVCMMVGNYTVPAKDVFPAIIGQGETGVVSVIQNVRLPRVAAAALVGAGLSIAGLTMQSLFKNPMASPSVLGISSGAAFGASIAISFGVGATIFGQYNTSAMAFLMCFATMALVYLIARSKYGISTVTLLLAGVAVGAFFNGLVSMMQYIADDDTLSAIVYWTMGSFNKVNWSNFSKSSFSIFVGVILLSFIYRELNLISAGEEQAANVGVNVKRTRLIAILGTSCCVAGAVAMAGTIGFVGLIVPHIFRMMVGPNHKLLIPMCIFGGATFLMIMDTIAKMSFVGSFPVGILTSLLGAPFFIYILKTRKKEIWE